MRLFWKKNQSTIPASESSTDPADAVPEVVEAPPQPPIPPTYAEPGEDFQVIEPVCNDPARYQSGPIQRINVPAIAVVAHNRNGTLVDGQPLLEETGKKAILRDWIQSNRLRGNAR